MGKDEWDRIFREAGLEGGTRHWYVTGERLWDGPVRVAGLRDEKKGLAKEVAEQLKDSGDDCAIIEDFRKQVTAALDNMAKHIDLLRDSVEQLQGKKLPAPRKPRAKKSLPKKTEETPREDPYPEIQLGDIVEVQEKFTECGMDFIKGMQGVVVSADVRNPDSSVGVDWFDELRTALGQKGHDLGGKGHDGHCWYVIRRPLKTVWRAK